MQKLKGIIFLIIFITIINIAIPVFADDEIEETGITIQEIEEILEATTDIEEIPKINSRNAVIYERISRKSFIWKARKHKMQDGIYYKNHEFNCGSRKCTKSKSENKSITKSSRNRWLEIRTSCE